MITNDPFATLIAATAIANPQRAAYADAIDAYRQDASYANASTLTETGTAWFAAIGYTPAPLMVAGEHDAIRDAVLMADTADRINDNYFAHRGACQVCGEMPEPEDRSCAECGAEVHRSPTQKGSGRVNVLSPDRKPAQLASTHRHHTPNGTHDQSHRQARS